jgi:hypothetical protein
MREVAALTARIKKYRERISHNMSADAPVTSITCAQCEKKEKDKLDRERDENRIGDDDEDDDDDWRACLCDELYEEHSSGGQGQGDGQGGEEGAAGVHCLESSMMNCYGLKSLHDYLQLPFLALKRDHFYHQMKHVEEEFNNADRALRIALLPASKAVYSAFARSYDSRARYCTGL